MAFTEFCCRSGGSNLNAGTRTGDSTIPGTAADFTYASGTWVSATGVFTVASGDPAADGVAVGDFASVYADGASVTTLVGRVTARDATTITVSLTAKSGTTTDGTSNRTLKIGGAWEGPNATSLFPIGFIENTCTNAAADAVRVNFNGTFDITNTSITISGSQYNNINYVGYGTAYGDRTRATWSWGTTAVANGMIFGTAANIHIDSIVFESVATSGSGEALKFNTRGYARNCVFSGWRLRGVNVSSTCVIEDCEFFGCAVSVAINSAAIYGSVTGGLTVRNTIVHNCAGHAVICEVGSFTFINCIFDTNGGEGINFRNTNASVSAINCDFYNNTGDGIDISNAGGTLHVSNCNFINNGGYGITTAGQTVYGSVINCGFGSGTAANTSGTISDESALTVLGSVTYPTDAVPWVDPANGDFRINLAAAKGAGLGTFVQTDVGYAGTVGYPDIGAAQHADAGGSTGGGYRNMAGGMQ